MNNLAMEVRFTLRFQNILFITFFCHGKNMNLCSRNETFPFESNSAVLLLNFSKLEFE
jgi:hypothetical protein